MLGSSFYYDLTSCTIFGISNVINYIEIAEKLYGTMRVGEMMKNKLPLSPLQEKLYMEVKENLVQGGCMFLQPTRDGRYKSILELMIQSGCVEYVQTLQGDTYVLRDDLKFFEEWLIDRQNEEKKSLNENGTLLW